MFSAKQKLGRGVEDAVRSYLIGAGLKFVAANYVCVGGEIDLIMQDGDNLVFVEVRYRQDDDYGGAVASVTKSKQHKIIHTAKMYLQENDLWDKVPCRFDVVVMQNAGENQEICWLKDAFWVK